MSVTEFQRHEVFKWLEEKMGPERAAIMMDLLPPVGWGDVATKRDLDASVDRLEVRLNARIDGVDARIDGLDARIDGLDARIGGVEARIDTVEARVVGEIHRVTSEMLMKLFFGMVASNATLVGLVFAAVRLG